jgi:hypothetical protein
MVLSGLEKFRCIQEMLDENGSEEEFNFSYMDDKAEDLKNK